MTGHSTRAFLRLAGVLPLLILCLATSAWMIAADRSETDLGIVTAEKDGHGLPIKNDPPKLLFARQSAILILIDGDPVYRPIDGTDLQRIINTKPFIARDAAGIHYLKLFDGWVQAYTLTGNWSVAGVPPRGAEQALQRAVAAKTVDLLDGATPGTPGDKPSLDTGAVPTIFISTGPADLIVTSGPPQFAAVEGTALEYIENTTAHVFKEPTDDELYVLISGRWFRSWRTDGPWQFVPSSELPADIVAIPDSSPQATVKASIAGTNQAREALMANAVPRTATIDRSQTRLTPPVIDGDPILQPIEGTSLSYVANSPMPIIARSTPTAYYAVEDGVWFVSSSIGGPWSVASSVPPAVYTIPPTSPLHYVSYVHVYGATADEVSVGYTAGYLGTVVSDGVVVYGTGYEYPPWIGSSWWGRPMTYGLGAEMTHEPSNGWNFGFGFGWNASRLGWGWGVSPWSEPIGWDWRGERYPWVWRGTRAVRVPSGEENDARGVGAWRVSPARNIYDRWQSGSRTTTTAAPERGAASPVECVCTRRAG
jgi:hypothetical protein